MYLVKRKKWLILILYLAKIWMLFVHGRWPSNFQDKSPHLIYMPIRSKLYLLWINTNGISLQHLWAKVVCWWLDHVSSRYNYEA